MKITTLALVHQDNRLLLGLKKRGFGMGRWNGFGGKVNPGESIPAATARELQEEAGITATSLEPRGLVRFEFADTPIPWDMHVFYVPAFMGEPVETEEMRPQWFELNQIPYDTMWPDDRHWLPLFLAGKIFKAEFHFADEQTIAHHTIAEVKNLA